MLPEDRLRENDAEIVAALQSWGRPLLVGLLAVLGIGAWLAKDMQAALVLLLLALIVKR